MSIRFAAPSMPGRHTANSPLARALVRRSIERVANDNGDTEGNDRLLRAALMQFAKHGIGAARAARAQAEHAFFTGDRKSYDWWIGVTRTLDRRIAAEVERRIPLNELG